MNDPRSYVVGTDFCAVVAGGAGMSGILFNAFCASCIVVCSSADRGAKFRMYERLSSICSRLLMPDSTVMTLRGSPRNGWPRKRWRPADLPYGKSSPPAPAGWRAYPPLTGSMMMTGFSCLRHFVAGSGLNGGIFPVSIVYFAIARIPFPGARTESAPVPPAWSGRRIPHA